MRDSIEKTRAYYREYRQRKREEAIAADPDWASKEYARNRERLLANKRRHREKYKKAGRWRTLYVKYGITKEDYERFFVLQGGVCALCGLPPLSDKNLVVDHDHDTNLLRGLLHFECNVLLGNAHDQTEVLQKAIRYLSVKGHPLVKGVILTSRPRGLPGRPRIS